MIQHRAGYFVLNKPSNIYQHDSITDMLKELNWPSLQERRKQLCLILMYKIVNHLLIVPEHCFPTPSPLTKTRAHHPQKFLHLQLTVDTYRYSFLLRTIPQWNNMSIPNLLDTDLTMLKNLIKLINYPFIIK